MIALSFHMLVGCSTWGDALVLLLRIAPEPMLEAGVPKKSPLISIVDDDASMRTAIKRLMRSFGYPAEAFASANEFIASPHLRHTACLIVDVNMPGMSGPELHRHLIASNTSIPTILITAYSDEEVRARVMNAGAIAYLTKPIEGADLLDCVHSALRETDQDE
jgi:FixJ family two-component response regulator